MNDIPDIENIHEDNNDRDENNAEFARINKNSNKLILFIEVSYVIYQKSR